MPDEIILELEGYKLKIAIGPGTEAPHYVLLDKDGNSVPYESLDRDRICAKALTKYGVVLPPESFVNRGGMAAFDGPALRTALAPDNRYPTNIPVGGNRHLELKAYEGTSEDGAAQKINVFYTLCDEKGKSININSKDVSKNISNVAQALNIEPGDLFEAPSGKEGRLRFHPTLLFQRQKAYFPEKIEVSRLPIFDENNNPVSEILPARAVPESVAAPTNGFLRLGSEERYKITPPDPQGNVKLIGQSGQHPPVDIAPGKPIFVVEKNGVLTVSPTAVGSSGSITVNEQGVTYKKNPNPAPAPNPPAPPAPVSAAPPTLGPQSAPPAPSVSEPSASPSVVLPAASNESTIATQERKISTSNWASDINTVRVPRGDGTFIEVSLSRNGRAAYKISREGATIPLDTPQDKAWVNKTQSLSCEYNSQTREWSIKLTGKGQATLPQDIFAQPADPPPRPFDLNRDAVAGTSSQIRQQTGLEINPPPLGNGAGDSTSSAAAPVSEKSKSFYTTTNKYPIETYIIKRNPNNSPPTLIINLKSQRSSGGTADLLLESLRARGLVQGGEVGQKDGRWFIQIKNPSQEVIDVVQMGESKKQGMLQTIYQPATINASPAPAQTPNLPMNASPPQNQPIKLGEANKIEIFVDGRTWTYVVKEQGGKLYLNYEGSQDRPIEIDSAREFPFPGSQDQRLRFENTSEGWRVTTAGEGNGTIEIKPMMTIRNRFANVVDPVAPPAPTPPRVSTPINPGHQGVGILEGTEFTATLFNEGRSYQAQFKFSKIDLPGGGKRFAIQYYDPLKRAYVENPPPGYRFADVTKAGSHQGIALQAGNSPETNGPEVVRLVRLNNGSYSLISNPEGPGVVATQPNGARIITTLILPNSPEAPPQNPFRQLAERGLIDRVVKPINGPNYKVYLAPGADRAQVEAVFERAGVKPLPKGIIFGLGNKNIIEVPAEAFRNITSQPFSEWTSGNNRIGFNQRGGEIVYTPPAAGQGFNVNANGGARVAIGQNGRGGFQQSAGGAQAAGAVDAAPSPVLRAGSAEVLPGAQSSEISGSTKSKQSIGFTGEGRQTLKPGQKLSVPPESVVTVHGPEGDVKFRVSMAPEIPGQPSSAKIVTELNQPLGANPAPNGQEIKVRGPDGKAYPLASVLPDPSRPGHLVVEVYRYNRNTQKALPDTATNSVTVQLAPETKVTPNNSPPPVAPSGPQISVDVDYKTENGKSTPERLRFTVEPRVGETAEQTRVRAATLGRNVEQYTKNPNPETVEVRPVPGTEKYKVTVKNLTQTGREYAQSLQDNSNQGNSNNAIASPEGNQTKTFIIPEDSISLPTKPAAAPAAPPVETGAEMSPTVSQPNPAAPQDAAVQSVNKPSPLPKASQVEISIPPETQITLMGLDGQRPTRYRVSFSQFKNEAHPTIMTHLLTPTEPHGTAPASQSGGLEALDSIAVVKPDGKHGPAIIFFEQDPANPGRILAKAAPGYVLVETSGQIMVLPNPVSSPKAEVNVSPGTNGRAAGAGAALPAGVEPGAQRLPVVKGAGRGAGAGAAGPAPAPMPLPPPGTRNPPVKPKPAAPAPNPVRPETPAPTDPVRSETVPSRPAADPVAETRPEAVAPVRSSSTSLNLLTGRGESFAMEPTSHAAAGNYAALMYLLGHTEIAQNHPGGFMALMAVQDFHRPGMVGNLRAIVGDRATSLVSNSRLSAASQVLESQGVQTAASTVTRAAGIINNGARIAIAVQAIAGISNAVGDHTALKELLGPGAENSQVVNSDFQNSATNSLISLAALVPVTGAGLASMALGHARGGNLSVIRAATLLHTSFYAGDRESVRVFVEAVRLTGFQHLSSGANSAIAYQNNNRRDLYTKNVMAMLYNSDINPNFAANVRGEAMLTPAGVLPFLNYRDPITGRYTNLELLTGDQQPPDWSKMHLPDRFDAERAFQKASTTAGITLVHWSGARNEGHLLNDTGEDPQDPRGSFTVTEDELVRKYLESARAGFEALAADHHFTREESVTVAWPCKDANGREVMRTYGCWADCIGDTQDTRERGIREAKYQEWAEQRKRDTLKEFDQNTGGGGKLRQGAEKRVRDAFQTAQNSLYKQYKLFHDTMVELGDRQDPEARASRTKWRTWYFGERDRILKNLQNVLDMRLCDDPGAEPVNPPRVLPKADGTGSFYYNDRPPLPSPEGFDLSQPLASGSSNPPDSFAAQRPSLPPTNVQRLTTFGVPQP